MQPGQRPRILYLTDTTVIGGAERRLIDFAQFIDRSRFDLHFASLSPDGPLLAEIRGLGYSSHALDVRRGLDLPSGFIRTIALIRQLRPTILHGQIRYAAFIGALAGRLCRVPVVMATRTYTTRLGGRDVLDRFTSGLVDATVAVSAAVHNRLVRIESVNTDKVALIENGIDLDHFVRPDRQTLERERVLLGLSGHTVIGTVGNLHAIKGHAYLVASAREVMASVPRVKFLIVGDGPLRAQLTDRARAEGVLDAFVFAGLRQDVPTLLGLMDVFVLPSLNEGMSHALLEAMALGRPVVATAVGGNVEVVEHGTSGLLVPPSDPHGLAEAIVALLGDEGTARRLGAAAGERVRTKFSTRRMVGEYVALYERLLTSLKAGPTGTLGSGPTGNVGTSQGVVGGAKR